MSRSSCGAAGTASSPGRVAHSLVPIALAYCAAHYINLLVFGGQSLAALASDRAGSAGTCSGPRPGASTTAS